MNTVIEIAQWVEKKPLILIRFDEELSDSWLNLQSGFEHLTISRPHTVFSDFKIPTLCLLEIIENDATKCYYREHKRFPFHAAYRTALSSK